MVQCSSLLQSTFWRLDLPHSAVLCHWIWTGQLLQFAKVTPAGFYLTLSSHVDTHGNVAVLAAVTHTSVQGPFISFKSCVKEGALL